MATSTAAGSGTRSDSTGARGVLGALDLSPEEATLLSNVLALHRSSRGQFMDAATAPEVDTQPHAAGASQQPLPVLPEGSTATQQLSAGNAGRVAKGGSGTPTSALRDVRSNGGHAGAHAASPRAAAPLRAVIHASQGDLGESLHQVDSDASARSMGPGPTWRMTGLRAGPLAVTRPATVASPSASTVTADGEGGDDVDGADSADEGGDNSLLGPSASLALSVVCFVAVVVFFVWPLYWLATSDDGKGDTVLPGAGAAVMVMVIVGIQVVVAQADSCGSAFKCCRGRCWWVVECCQARLNAHHDTAMPAAFTQRSMRSFRSQRSAAFTVAGVDSSRRVRRTPTIRIGTARRVMPMQSGVRGGMFAPSAMRQRSGMRGMVGRSGVLRQSSGLSAVRGAHGRSFFSRDSSRRVPQRPVRWGDLRNRSTSRLQSHNGNGGGDEESYRSADSMPSIAPLSPSARLAEVLRSAISNEFYELYQLAITGLGIWSWLYFSYNVTVVFDGEQTTYALTGLTHRGRDRFFSREVFLSVSVAMDILLRVFSARRPWRTLASFYVLVDVITFFFVAYYQPLNASGTWNAWTAYSMYLCSGPLRVLRLRRCIQALDQVRTALGDYITVGPFQLSAATAEIVVVATRVLQYVLGCAAIIVTVEFPCAPLLVMHESASYTEAMELCSSDLQQFHQALYFIVVTLSTVGYGDIHPATTVGRLVTAVLIVIGLVAIPAQIAEFRKVVVRPFEQAMEDAELAEEQEQEQEQEGDGEGHVAGDVHAAQLEGNGPGTTTADDDAFARFMQDSGRAGRGREMAPSGADDKAMLHGLMLAVQRLQASVQELAQDVAQAKQAK